MIVPIKYSFNCFQRGKVIEGLVFILVAWRWLAFGDGLAELKILLW